MKYFNINIKPTEQKDIYEITKNNLGVVCKESAPFPYNRPRNLMSHDILGFLNYLMKWTILTYFMCSTEI